MDADAAFGNGLTQPQIILALGKVVKSENVTHIIKPCLHYT